MTDCIERKLGKLLVRIDRGVCIGSGNCVNIAPEVFELDERQTVRFTESAPEIESERIVEACATCPVEALSVLDEDGSQLVP